MTFSPADRGTTSANSQKTKVSTGHWDLRLYILACRGGTGDGIVLTLASSTDEAHRKYGSLVSKYTSCTYAVSPCDNNVLTVVVFVISYCSLRGTSAADDWPSNH